MTIELDERYGEGQRYVIRQGKPRFSTSRKFGYEPRFAKTTHDKIVERLNEG